MADLKISALAALAGGNLASNDLLPIVDLSASETKKITVVDLVGNATTLIADATIPGAKILFGTAQVPGSALIDSGVSTSKLANDAVTAAKLGDESTVDLVTTLPASGAFIGQLALDTDDLKVYCWNGSSWQSIKAAGSINTVTGSGAGIVNVSVVTSGDTVTISTTLDNTTSASQFLAGPTSAGGAVSYRAIAGTDLPTPTTSAKGGVIVNGNGLTMSGSTIAIDNTVTANSAAYHLVQYTSKGLVSAGRTITGSDLPLATGASVGAIRPDTDLSVTAAGVLSHSNSVTPATATKITYNAQGHVTAGTTLTAADIPEISAAKITSGTLATSIIANDSIDGTKLANASTVKFGGSGSTAGVVTFPTAEFQGQYFFDALNGDLYLYDGAAWQPITITSGELIYAGTYNAALNQVKSLTAAGTAVGMVVGASLPVASSSNLRYYLVVSDSGNGVAPAPAVALAPPDMIVSNGNTWELIDVSNAIAGQIAANISFTPYGNVAATNVQIALQELDDEKLAKAGGTVTGNLEIGSTGSLTFEGSTADGFETAVAVTNPTADRTITLPDATGTVTLSGAIVNADINASAAIADTKLATISTAGKVSNSATTATSANTASAIVARDVSGNFSAGTITASLTGTASTATNIAGGSLGTVPYQSAAGTTAMLATGTSGQALVSAGAAAPAWTTLTMENLPGAAFKSSVTCATTASITLSGTQTIDGVAVVAGNRVLVKNQATASQNGIYVVAAGAWTRAADADTAAEIAGGLVNVDSGTQGGQLWTTDFKTTDTLGTTSMNWYRSVDASLASSTAPGNIGTAAAGTSTSYSRADHVHDLPNTAVTAGSYGSGSQVPVITVDAKGRITAASIAAVTSATATNLSGGSLGTIPYQSAANTTAMLATGTAGQALVSAGAAAPAWTTLTLENLPDAAFKKSVRVATTADVGASTFAAGVLTGYDDVVNLNVTTTLSSTTATTTSTAGIKVGAVISGNANIPGSTTVASITNATTFVMSAAATAAGTAVATTFTQTIAALAVDGVTLALDDRVLVKDQATPARNGIYRLSTLGSTTTAWVLTRTNDADSASEIAGAIVNVDSGTTNGARLFTAAFKTTDTINSTSMVWSEIIDTSAANSTAGTIAMNGVQAAGTSNLYARADHVHPTDTSRAAVGQTMFIGTTSTAINRASANQALTGISSVAMPGATSGTVTVQPAAVAGTTTITYPATTGTLITTGDSATVTNTMLAGSITDTKLSTISTAGKVSNSATTATSANTASAIVARDASGNFTAGTITAALTGNASTATTLQTARNIQGVSFNGSADITVVTPGTGISVTGTAVANTGVLSVNGSTGAITNVAVTNTAQSFTAAQRGTISALTDGATITPNFATANNFSVTLAGNRTLANPTNLTAGQSGTIVITQDATGTRTLAYGSNWKFPGGTAPTLTTTANAVDVITYYVESATRITARLISDVK